MPDIYQTAWAILKDRVARSRKQSIPRAELLTWQLQALEAAVDRFYFERGEAGHQGRYPKGSLHEQVQHGQQEKA